MSVFNTNNSDVTTGLITNYNFYKVIQQTKTAMINIIYEFLDSRNMLFKQDMEEIPSMQSSKTQEDNKNLYIYRDFPETDRKFPCIIISTENATEMKPYIGADNFLYTQEYVTSSGTTYDDVYAGMAMVTNQITILAESGDARNKICELLFMCFGNYFRGQFIYKGDDGSQFIITPAQEALQFGSEQEAKEDSMKQQIYLQTMNIVNHIEYHYVSYIDGPERYTKIDTVKGYGSVIEIPVIGL